MDSLNEKMIADIASIKESLKSAHKRIDENDRVTEGIHKIAANVETLALQVKMLTESVEDSVKRIESSLRLQGERIGLLETKPAKRWESLVSQIISAVTAGIIGMVLGRLL